MFELRSYLLGLALMAAIALVTWSVSAAKRDVGIVDSVWAIFFLAAAALYATTVTAPGPRTALIVTLVAIWALRLSGYITWRGWGEPEDHRYQTIRRRHEPNFALKSLYLVFALQAVLAWIVSLPLLGAIASPAPLNLLDFIGVALWVFGFLFESIGDFQLAGFKSDPAHRGKVMDQGLWRYTRHPNYFGEDLMDAVAELPKVMPHIEVPIQAGDDQVLTNMKRGYTQKEYRDLVEKIRARIPDSSIATDIIVGFPGETDEQFMETYRVLSDLRLDVAHLARYSSREGTVATRRMDDNISDEEKMRRFRMLEELQEQVVAEINKKYLGQSVEVLFEDKVKNRWKGRTPTNKLVFVESQEDLKGKILAVTVTWTGPWSMQANLAGVHSQKQLELLSL